MHRNGVRLFFFSLPATCGGGTMMEEEIERERNVERERCQILLDSEIGLEYNKLG